VPVRKPGKLPRDVHGMDYDLEYGTDRLEIHADAIGAGQKILLVDDVLATGGTMRAKCDLAEKIGAEVVGITVLIELTFLGGRDKLARHGESVHGVLKF
jgi:adenine phosphoribosyltransferase